METTYQKPNYSVDHQPKFEWCKNPKTGKKLPYDFLLSSDLFSTQLIIELDGPQHFRQISNWKSPERQQETDRYKDRMAKYNGYSIIRVLQEEVLENENKWDANLNTAISLVTISPFPLIINIFDDKIECIEYKTILVWKS